jgi:hypothetical protein
VRSDTRSVEHRPYHSLVAYVIVDPVPQPAWFRETSDSPLVPPEPPSPRLGGAFAVRAGPDEFNAEWPGDVIAGDVREA